MGSKLLPPESLPQRTVTQVKNEWGELIREVRSSGCVAITRRSKIEMIVVEASRYRELAGFAGATQTQDHALLSELAAEFDRHLAMLKASDAYERADAVFRSRGRAKRRPKAGTSY